MVVPSASRSTAGTATPSARRWAAKACSAASWAAERTSTWCRLTNTSLPPQRTRAAADIGRGLRHSSTAVAPGSPYRASTAFTSSADSGGQSGSTSALPMPCARNAASPVPPAAPGVEAIRGQAAVTCRSARSARAPAAEVRPPTTRVATAATANEQIDADIHTWGVNPIAWATCVHADTHQEM